MGLRLQQKIILISIRTRGAVSRAADEMTLNTVLDPVKIWDQATSSKNVMDPQRWPSDPENGKFLKTIVFFIGQFS